MNVDESYLPPGLGKVLLELFGDCGVDVLLGLLARDPAVVQGGLAGQSHLHVDAHERPDEVLGLLTDIVPVGGVELKFS